MFQYVYRKAVFFDFFELVANMPLAQRSTASPGSLSMIAPRNYRSAGHCHNIAACFFPPSNPMITFHSIRARMHQTRPASAARAGPTTAASPAPEPNPKQAHKSAGARVGALNRVEGAWERTFNCEDVDTDLRDFWAIVLEGTSRAKLQVNCAPFAVLDANCEPTFIMQQHQLPDKKAGHADARRSTGGAVHVTGMYIDGSSSDATWAALQKQIESWPRAVLKRRIADAAPEKGAQGLSSTQLLLAQLVSGCSTSNSLEVAKTLRHELVPIAHAAKVADAMMRLRQKLSFDEEEARKLTESSAAGGRKKSATDGQKVIQARMRDDSGEVIDYRVCEGVTGFK